MAENTPGREIRDHIRSMDRNLGARLDSLWDTAAGIHDFQSAPGGITDFGRRHVMQIENNIWHLITHTTKEQGKTMLEDFSPYELFLLSAAAYCHDFDKALFPDSVAPSSYHISHGEGSAEFVTKNHQMLGMSQSESDDIAGIIQAQDYLSTQNTRLTEVGPVNFRRLATLLRVADYLHLDNSRNSSIFRSANVLNQLDRMKYLARGCIRGWKIDGHCIVILAMSETEEEFDSLNHMAQSMLNTEWPIVQENMQLYGFPYELRFEIQKPQIVGKDPPSIENDDSFQKELNSIMEQLPEQPTIEFFCEPGRASSESIKALLTALSDYHIAQGGLGLEFKVDGQYVVSSTEVRI